MIEQCNFDKSVKYEPTKPNMSQMIRAFKTYPNCDAKRTGLCSPKSCKNTQK